MKFIASIRFEKVFLFLPRLSVKAIEFLFDEIELTGKLTEISCPLMLYDICHTPYLNYHPWVRKLFNKNILGIF
jgi:hypothetical protein